MSNYLIGEVVTQNVIVSYLKIKQHLL